jgi:uncharacterized protein DUF4058
MPSPFPGMDPYLEGSYWSTVHTQLVPEIARQLSPKIHPKYLALTSRRFFMDEPDEVGLTLAEMYPDIGLAHADQGPPVSEAAATALAPPPLRMVTVVPAPVPQLTVEIRDVDNQALVTAIEVLSPANKRGPGRKQYLAKRKRLLYSSANLVEIDLLRVGRRVPMRKPLPKVPYIVLVGRVDKRPVTDVWPIRLDQPLPTVPIPLLPGDPDVTLDLQLAFTTVYDLVGYNLTINYSKPPDVPFSPEEVTFTEELLRPIRRRKEP